MGVAANDPPRGARTAVTAVFFVNGAVFSSLFSRLPAIKDDLGLSDGELGVALLFSMVGLVIAQLGAGAAVTRWGVRDAMRAIGPVYACAAALPAAAPSVETFALALLVLGSANGALDLTMNVEGAAVERRYGRPIMSSLHAAFSFGALAGASAGALVAAADVAPERHMAAVAVLALVVALIAVRELLPDRPDERGSTLLARPTRGLAALGVLAFCVLLAEGSVADWSAVYLRDSVDTSPGLAAAGLAAFSLTMAVGRLIGDRLTAALGRVRLATGGSLLAAIGLGLGLAAGDPATTIAGFAAMGAGLATTFPLVVTAAANRGEAASGAALAAVTTTGYSGFMIGPPLIGFLAEALSLRAALLLPVALCLLAAALAPAVTRQSTGQPAS
jgi:predicted MFS family arabinose efflux permease